jgi:carbonic anhydrase/acetyltransferase-like protein (isoleucine patch superfamily)
MNIVIVLLNLFFSLRNVNSKHLHPLKKINNSITKTDGNKLVPTLLYLTKKLNMRYSLLFLLASFSAGVFAQKQVYIPQEWRAGLFDYSFERSSESENFIVFWGPKAAQDPRDSDPSIAFDPNFILQTAEDLYRFYIDDMKYIPGDSGLITEWKIILVLLHTWEGIEGWAFGGNYDGVTGAMWMHPHAAQHGPTLAHEFTHALQNYTWMMYPGHGFVNHSYVGFFWETHAEFMSMQRYPEVARHFDISRWMNTAQFHWSSTRHHYQAFIFLQYIKEVMGIEIIHRMWRESIIGEHPLQTLKRIGGFDQVALNDYFGDYARRNVKWDYEIGDLLREATAALPPQFRLNPTIIPEKVADNIYRIQDHRAPQDYGYNIIRIIPQIPDSCDKRAIYLHFQGVSDGNPQAGWRYSLVAVGRNGQSRYSDLYDTSEEVEFEWMDDDIECYLVVSGAPQQHHNYDWEIGFPKIYRYPYAFKLHHAVVDGYQEGYTQIDPPSNSKVHTNGGGFVAESAYVAPSAFVAEGALVLNEARVESNARIEGHAIVRDRARVEDSAIVSDYAIIGEEAVVRQSARVSGFSRIWGNSNISGNATVSGHSCLFWTRVGEQATTTGNTFCWGANLQGDVLLGGDAEYFMSCSAGIYMQVQGAYGRECDGETAHPANIEVNLPYFWPEEEELAFSIDTDCTAPLRVFESESKAMWLAFPNPTSHSMLIFSDAAISGFQWELINTFGNVLLSGRSAAQSMELQLNGLPAGFYFLRLQSGDNQHLLRVLKQ